MLGVRLICVGKMRERFYADVWTDLNLEPEEDEEALADAGWDLRYRPVTWMQFQAKAPMVVKNTKAPRFIFDKPAGMLIS